MASLQGSCASGPDRDIAGVVRADADGSPEDGPVDLARRECGRAGIGHGEAITGDEGVANLRGPAFDVESDAGPAGGAHLDVVPEKRAAAVIEDEAEVATRVAGERVEVDVPQ